jgi:hypothetical protein
MSYLAAIASLKEVRGAVLGDLSGGFHEGVGEEDGEAVAAAFGFVATSLAQAGAQLGLGALRIVSVASEAQAHLVLVRGSSVVTARVDLGGRSLASLEKVIDASLKGEG